MTVLDTNLFLLLVAGAADQRLIKAHKRLQNYAPSDYALLLSLLGRFATLVLLPNVLTETSNLLAQIGEPARTMLLTQLTTFTAAHPERYVPSATAMQQPEYTRLGLTDAAILTALADGARLLTSDAALHRAALRRGYGSTNFFHERDMAGSKQ